MITPEQLDRLLTIAANGESEEVFLDEQTKVYCKRIVWATNHFAGAGPLPGQSHRQWRLEYLEDLIDFVNRIRESDRKQAESN